VCVGLAMHVGTHVVNGEQADLNGGRKSGDFPRTSP